MDRGFSTGAMQYGYDKIPVFDPSGATDPDGRPVVIGRRIQVNADEASIINRIFEWAADGVGVGTIVDRLNREGIPGTAGKRWNQTPVKRILHNERYLGRQIYGQQAVEREPSTGRKIMRERPRSEWKIIERPEMRIVSDELWERTQATRKAVREAVAPKTALARGKSGKYHSKHLFSGFAKCGECGATISTVSGGKGSPRLGCSRSWRNGTSSCGNRLTIRVKVAEPQILAKLQAELLKPEAVAYVTQRLEKEIKKALAGGSKNSDDVRRRLQQEKRKVQNLVTALAEGASNSASVLAAIAEKEKIIAQFERELESAPVKRAEVPLADLRRWVEGQLSDLVALLKFDVPKVKAEFRRLNLALTFTPTDASPRPHFVVTGQCDLSALAFSFVRPRSSAASSRLGALVDLFRANQAQARSSLPAPFTIAALAARSRSSR
jgi:site-specific DNA recombinase